MDEVPKMTTKEHPENSDMITMALAIIITFITVFVLIVVL